jgi:hypothetical protein
LITLVEVALDSQTDQTSKDQTLKTGFEKFMKDEQRKLNGYKENVNIYANMSKKYVSEINVRKLKPLIAKPNVNQLFKFLFSLLYNKPESEYDATKFGKLALGSDADDFQIKLASFNTARFHQKPELAEQFKRMKDQEFPDAETNVDLSNLLNWMDYVHEMYLAEVEFKQQQSNLKSNQSEFGERLLKISLGEEDSKRKRQAVQIYKHALAQIETDKKLVEQKKNIIQEMSHSINVDKTGFLRELEKFRKEMYDLPNHF